MDEAAGNSRAQQTDLEGGTTRQDGRGRRFVVCRHYCRTEEMTFPVDGQTQEDDMRLPSESDCRSRSAGAVLENRLAAECLLGNDSPENDGVVGGAD